MPEPNADDALPPFEAALGQIEGIVLELERGTLDLDAALDRFERGIRLLSHCRSALQVAERRVALLTGTAEDGEPVTSPFDEPSMPVAGDSDGDV